MDFSIRRDAREWFRYIRDEFVALPGTAAPSARDFDAFYFCFVAGIAEIRKRDVPASETAALVENFPGPFKARGRVLVALFLSRELHYLGVVINERSTVHSAISRLIDPEAANFLSDDGVREFNKYAHGGYDVLLDWFDEEPRALDTFLRTFKRKLDNAFQR